MELICNELSLYPLVKSSQEAEKHFNNALKTFLVFQTKYGFNHIKFPVNFNTQNITTTLTFVEWIQTISSRVLKEAVIKLFRPPFTDDLDKEDLETYFQSEYLILDNDAPVKENPIGLPVAYILSYPTISFNTHSFWQSKKINLTKTNTNETENLQFFTYNISTETDFETKEFIEWAETAMSKKITTPLVLKQYLGFTKYQIAFTEDFFTQLMVWKKDDFKIYKYILLLMKDVQMHPFTGGMGQTENLKYRGKEASKRITNSFPDGDRLSYFLDNNIVTFVACKGHYKFH